MEFNTEYAGDVHECTVTVTDGTTPVTGAATLTSGNPLHARAEIMLEANVTETQSSVYVDNIKVYTVLPFDIENADPANRTTILTTEKLYITLTNPVDTTVGNIQYNNGDEIAVSTLELTNGNRTLEIPVSAESGKYNTLKLIGLKDIFGNSLSDFVNFNTVNRAFNFGSVVFTNSSDEVITEIEPGMITATIKVNAFVTDTKKVVFYTALYNSDTNEMLAIDSDKCTVTEDEKTLITTLEVSDDADSNYKMKTYLWEDVTPLVGSSVLE